MIPLGTIAQINDTTATSGYIDETDIAKVIRGKNSKKKTTGMPEKGKLMAFGAPVFGSNPSLGTFYGLGGTGAIYFGEPATTNISNFTVSLQFTTKNQFIGALKGTVMTSDNLWEMLIDAKYSIFSENTYGLGSDYNQPIQEGWNWGGTQAEGIAGAQPLSYQYIRFHYTALREMTSHLYFGIGVHIDYHYKITDDSLNLEAEVPVITSHYAYNTLMGYDQGEYASIGTSINAIYDSRDHTVNPYKGAFLQATYRVNSEWLGSTQNHQQLYLETRVYKSLSKKMPRHLIAFWGIGQFTTDGNVPYLDLPANAGDMRNRIGRGYVASRFRGDNWVTAETEYRFPITRNGLLGGVLFANATTTSRPEFTLGEETFEKLKLFEAIRPGYGYGLRLMLTRAGRLNLGMDMAYGQNGSKGFYFSVGETF
jgi:outer membrane protein assembly factor BamA